MGQLELTALLWALGCSRARGSAPGSDPLILNGCDCIYAAHSYLVSPHRAVTKFKWEFGLGLSLSSLVAKRSVLGFSDSWASCSGDANGRPRGFNSFPRWIDDGEDLREDPRSRFVVFWFRQREIVSLSFQSQGLSDLRQGKACSQGSRRWKTYVKCTPSMIFFFFVWLLGKKMRLEKKGIRNLNNDFWLIVNDKFFIFWVMFANLILMTVWEIAGKGTRVRNPSSSFLIHHWFMTKHLVVFVVGFLDLISLRVSRN